MVSNYLFTANWSSISGHIALLENTMKTLIAFYLVTIPNLQSHNLFFFKVTWVITNVYLTGRHFLQTLFTGLDPFSSNFAVSLLSCSKWHIVVTYYYTETISVDCINISYHFNPKMFPLYFLQNLISLLVSGVVPVI